MHKNLGNFLIAVNHQLYLGAQKAFNIILKSLNGLYLFWLVDSKRIKLLKNYFPEYLEVSSWIFTCDRAKAILYRIQLSQKVTFKRLVF